MASKQPYPQPQKRPCPFAASSQYNVPDLKDRYDRFCTSCSNILDNLALERYPGRQCKKCLNEIDFLKDDGGLYKACVRCTSMLKCTMKFCYMCGRENVFFDPEKPKRVLNKLKQEIAAKLKNSNSVPASDNSTDQMVNTLSKSLMEDGEDFSIDDIPSTSTSTVTNPTYSE